MPHVSKRNVPVETKERLEKNLFNLLMDTSGNSRQRIFKELYTPTERLMFAKRIGMLVLIERGVSTYAIGKMLGVSSSTVLRFEVAVERGGYKETRRRLKHTDVDNGFVKFLIDIGTIPFGPRRKNLARLIDEL